MTAQEYIEKGYKVSANMEQSVIDRAEKEVISGYLDALDADSESDEYKTAVMALAFLRLAQLQLFATPAGGRVKTNQFSQSVENQAALYNQALVCYNALKVVKVGERAWEKPTVDVCGIFFVSSYFYV